MQVNTSIYLSHAEETGHARGRAPRFRGLVLNGIGLSTPFVNPRKAAAAIVGAVVLLLGVVFALQGANVIGGSAIMSGNSAYIYVGGVVALVGLVILLYAARIGAVPNRAAQPSAEPATR